MFWVIDVNIARFFQGFKKLFLSAFYYILKCKHPDHCGFLVLFGCEIRKQILSLPPKG